MLTPRACRSTNYDQDREELDSELAEHLTMEELESEDYTSRSSQSTALPLKRRASNDPSFEQRDRKKAKGVSLFHGAPFSNIIL